MSVAIHFLLFSEMMTYQVLSFELIIECRLFSSCLSFQVSNWYSSSCSGWHDSDLCGLYHINSLTLCSTTEILAGAWWTGDNEVTLCIFPNHRLGCGLVGSVVLYPGMQFPQTLSYHPSSCQSPWQRHHFAPSDQRWQRESVLVAQSCSTLCDPMDCSLPGSSVRGILQARILEWVAMPSFSRFSWPRDPAQVPCISQSEPLAKPWRWRRLLVIRVPQASSLAGAFNPPRVPVNNSFIKLSQLSLSCVL